MSELQPRGQTAMFLYTICPTCQTGYDLPDLMAGKKLRCKTCAAPFSVTASPRPPQLPPLQPFPKLGLPGQPIELPASAVVAEAGEPVAAPTYLHHPRVDLERPLVRPGARPSSAPPPSTGTGWWKGGGVGTVILVMLLIRGCAAITRTTTQPPPYNPPPVQWRQQQQWQFNPPAQNQWPDNPNNPGDRPADGNNNLPPPQRRGRDP